MSKPYALRPLPFQKRRKTKEEKERSLYYGRIHAQNRIELNLRLRKDAEASATLTPNTNAQA